MIILEELRKIIGQALGKENIFGYQTTLANQLYLLYCFCGKIYFVDKIAKVIRYPMLALHLFALMTGCAIGLWHLLYNAGTETWVQLYVINYTIVFILLGIVLPIVLYHHDEKIELAISAIDRILSKTQTQGCSPPRGSINIKNMMIGNIVLLFGWAFLLCCACTIDIVFFYEDEKPKNMMYYTLPIPKTETYGDLSFYLVCNTCTTFIFVFITVEWLALIGLVLLWNAICHNQLIHISDQIHTRSADLCELKENQQTPSEAWNRAYSDVLAQGANAFEQIIRLNSSFNDFVQVIASIMIPATFFVELAQLYITLSENLPVSVQLKGTGYLMDLGWSLFLLFWITDQLENSVSAVSNSIYFMPWCWSTKVRKDTCIFISQTRRVKMASIMKFWPLSLRTFANYVSKLFSATNVLRKFSNQ